MCLCRVPILLYHMIPGAYMAVGPFPSIQQSSTSRLPLHCEPYGSDALYLVGSAHQQTDLSNIFDICCLGL